jgi:hypothetical protein
MWNERLGPARVALEKDACFIQPAPAHHNGPQIHEHSAKNAPVPGRSGRLCDQPLEQFPGTGELGLGIREPPRSPADRAEVVVRQREGPPGCCVRKRAHKTLAAAQGVLSLFEPADAVEQVAERPLRFGQMTPAVCRAW